MNGYTLSTCNVTGYKVSRNRLAAFPEFDKYIIHALYDHTVC